MMAIKKHFPGAVVWKPADSFNLGIPDIHAAIPPDGRFLVAEVKQVNKLFALGEMVNMDQDKHLLRHTFSGPQISMLRKFSKAGVESYGLIRTHSQMAYKIHPKNIPLDGQITPRVLFSCGEAFTRDGGWRFWNELC